ncbi:GGDEF domain-containing protein [Photobacterium lipolyticum]|uniref:diguanylate cyclase n=1 Tax=Photobacterium lipolyticum TaxID=266810 RepID=A0A2T3N0H5_9GAMM|nr:GGDEF domain-containing protein [Photobacterium lipolyticum]PSW05677.1 GGDEF domain-containing protein [Photobacterium lipolyticum]
MDKKKQTMRESLEPLIKSVKLYLPDLWSSKTHTSSFQNTRSGYLRNRTSLLSIVWGVLFLLWIPFDLCFLPLEQGLKITIARISLGILLFLLAKKNHEHTSLRQAQWCISALVIAFNLFYFYSIMVLDFPQAFSSYEYGYTLLPIIHIAVLTILPLTLKESLGLLAATILTQISVNLIAERLLSPENLANYWLQAVLALMVLWSQLSKLYMLMRLYRQATLDPLTGIYNRRMLLQLAQKSLINCELKGNSFSVLLFDIDKFKRINDTWGHGAGDKVLRGFTDFMQTKIRKTDLFGRYGGEEFVLFLPRCDQAMAHKISERMLDSIRKLDFPIGLDDTHLSITTCIGISTYSPGDTLSSMLERADRALYECKKSGRDCCRFHPVGHLHLESERRQAVA